MSLRKNAKTKSGPLVHQNAIVTDIKPFRHWSEPCQTVVRDTGQALDIILPAQAINF